MKRSGSFSGSTSKRAYPMEMDSASTEIDTGILALNDDCLFEVFQYLKWRDLGVVSDVCNRLRHSARAYFAHSKKDDLDICLRIVRNRITDVTFNRMILKASRCLRNFGEFIIRVEAGIKSGGDRHLPRRKKEKYSRAIIELLLRYPSQTITELNLDSIHFDDDLTPSMGPLFEGLHKFTMKYCGNLGMFLDHWPLWTAELRELRWDYLPLTSEQCHRFFRPFPKLTKIAFISMGQLTHADIVEMIRHNPQLKDVEIRRCRSHNLTPLETILPAIAEHLPGIECLYLGWFNMNSISLEPITVHYFAQLKKLRSLKLYLPGEDANADRKASEYMVLALRAIGAAGISLKCLSLKYVDFGSDADANGFVDAISRFRELEALYIHPLDGFTSSHLIEISKHCSELSTLHTAGRDPYTTPDDILKIIPCFSKLRELHIGGNSDVVRLHFCIDVSIFEKLVRIADGRNRHLTLRLHPWSYSLNVPNDLLRAHQKSLSIECSHEFFLNAYSN